jgi:osmotically-inducible protein OsmY
VGQPVWVVALVVRSVAELVSVKRPLPDPNLLLGAPVGVAVSGGVVRLTGARDRAARRLAGVLARSVPGVVAVTFADRS